MAFATFLSRICGLVREQVFAFLFGAGKWTDCFNVAFRIPNLLRDLFAEGAMSAAFVPTFNATMKNDGRPRAFQLTNLTLTTLFVIVGVLTIFGIIFAPFLVGLLAPEFKSDPEKFAVTVRMTRIMFPFLLAISWAAIAMGILNSLGEFFIPAIAPVLLNLSMILAGFLLCPLMPQFGYQPIIGMAFGAMLGGALQMAFQFPFLFRHGFSLKLAWNLKDKGLRRIVRLIIPGTIGLAATQINVAVSTILATSQETGAVSWLGYAFRIMQLPLGIFGVAVAQATLPVISRQAADSDSESMSTTLGDSISLTGFINLSAMLFLIGLAEPTIRILFQHGRFSAFDTGQTAMALRAYALGIFFFSAIKVITPAFYALDDTKVPVKASFISVFTNIFLNLSFVKFFGYWGLALGTSIAAGVNFSILVWFLLRRLPPLRNIGLFFGLIRSLLAAAIGAIPAHYGFFFFSNFLVAQGFAKGSAASDLLSLVAAGGIGVFFLMLGAKILGIKEASRALGLIGKKLGRG